MPKCAHTRYCSSSCRLQSAYLVSNCSVYLLLVQHGIAVLLICCKAYRWSAEANCLWCVQRGDKILPADLMQGIKAPPPEPDMAVARPAAASLPTPAVVRPASQPARPSPQASRPSLHPLHVHLLLMQNHCCNHVWSHMFHSTFTL